MQPLTPMRVLLWLAIAVGALLCFVGAVGVLTRQVNGTAIFGVCGTVLTGIISALALRLGSTNNDDRGKKR